MRIVVATAEPRGAYHLAPLAQAINAYRDEGVDVTHLLPYPEDPQGPVGVKCTADISVLHGADRVVVTGGSLSAWTALVVESCVTNRLPVAFSELASVPAQPSDSPHGGSFAAATALSVDGARCVSKHHNIPLERIVVTGTPQLDGLPAWEPVSGRVLLLSTSDAATRDPDLVLVAAGKVLRDLGHDVVVRLHPREDPAPWEGFVVSRADSVLTDAHHSEVVVGYPGSVHVVVAALGCPVVAVAPTRELGAVLTAAQKRAIPAHTSGLKDTLEAVTDAALPDCAAVADVVGPVGGSARRVVSAWSEPWW